MSLTRLVRPNDPVIAALLAGVPAAAGAAAVLRAVEREVAGWAVDPRPGPAPDHASVVAARSANGVNLATLVCACLRRAGTRRAFVLMGSPSGTYPAGAHAWVVYRDEMDGPARRVDPPSLRPEPVTAAWIRGVDPVAAWHDERVAVGCAVLPTLLEALDLKEMP